MKTTNDAKGNSTVTLNRAESDQWETSQVFRHDTRFLARTALRRASAKAEICSYDGLVLEVVTRASRAS